jgi:DNA-nicking Smr family endonuclease
VSGKGSKPKAGKAGTKAGTKGGGEGSFADKLSQVRAALDAEQAKRAATPKPGASPAPRPGPPRAVGPARPPAQKPVPGDDALSFHRLVAGVTPIEGKHRRIPQTQSEVSPSSFTEELAARAQREADDDERLVRERLRALVEGGGTFEVVDDGRRVEGRRADVSPAQLRALRHGRMPVDARLDLHGLSVQDARAHLEAFLRDQRVRGERCVLVIHGKGAHSPGEHGVLRGEMAAWLSQGPASEHVAAFATAQDGDGGEGAIYVALRR